jgi:mannose/cellobiose epimerase-like protein (N-acyl-D-glucosamine 2-epimerase family)
MIFSFGTRVILGFFVICVLPGCEPGDKEVTQRNLDQPNTTKLSLLRADIIDDNLEPRLKYGLLPNGFYQPELARDWTPAPPEQQKAWLLSQSRFIYIMAMGYEVASDPRYLDAMELAADYLLDNFAHPNLPGHWLQELDHTGKVTKAGFHAYGHTQALFALSHAYKITGDPRFKAAAFQTWLALAVPSAIAGEHQFYQLEHLNVAMHLFEALLVFYKAIQSPMVFEDLEALAEYIVSHFYSPEGGFFGESLTSDLKLVADGEVRLGHSIEIAFLLSRAVDQGLPSSYLHAANTSVDYVAAIAAKDPRGILPHATNYTAEVTDGNYYWWSQTELLRGLAHFSTRHNRTALQKQYEKTRDAVQHYFLDTEYNGWYSRPDATEKPKGYQWKVGYHVIMMQTELMRLNGASFRSGSEVLL